MAHLSKRKSLLDIAKKGGPAVVPEMGYDCVKPFRLRRQKIPKTVGEKETGR
jgi:hypothetical protein